MIYTLRIVKEGAAVLDGTTPLDLEAPGVTIDNTTEPGTLVVTVPDGVALGTFDPGEVLERMGSSGRTFAVSSISAASAGGAYAAGDLIERVTPVAGAQANRDTVDDLESTGGSPTNTRHFFMPRHLVALTTVTAGPHTLSFLIKPIEDEDLEVALTEGEAAAASSSFANLSVSGAIESRAFNDSGGVLAVGANVVRGTSVDNSVILAAGVANLDGVMAVVQGGANQEFVTVAEGGIFWVSVTGVVARGDFLETSGIAGVAAVQVFAPPSPGCFAIAVGSKAGAGVGLVLARYFRMEGF